MALLRRSTNPRQLDLDLALRVMSLEAPRLEHRQLAPVLEWARLADGFRGADAEPPPLAQFEETSSFEAEQWRRLALMVRLLRSPAGTHLLQDAGPAEAFTRSLLKLATELSAHTMALLRQSAVRSEEFVRRLAAEHQWPIVGEPARASKQRLKEIDYARLLAEAEQARGSAEQRMELLRKLQEEQERKLARRRRGKW